jgi:asparagine synthase (glutamine-hydrolysing)
MARIVVAAGAQPIHARSRISDLPRDVPGRYVRAGEQFEAWLVETGSGAGWLYGDGALIVAIEGEPRWSDPTLAATASADGHACAVAAAYRDHGARFLDRLGGGFAVVVADVAGRTLCLANDRMGQRPLCFGGDLERIVVAASRPADVRRVLGGSAPIDPQAIYDYVYFHMVPSPGTIYQGISKLEPGERVQIDARGARRGRYWEPVLGERPDARADLEQAVVDALTGAVNARADVAGAAFLSGGLDSSTVVGLLARARGGDVDAYSIGFAMDGYDEMSYARLAATHFGVRHHPYYVTPDDVAQALPLIAAAYDEPFGNSSAVPAYYCALHARADGHRVILAGDGGDELFAGNARYAKQKVFERYRWIPRLMRAALIEPLLASPVAGLGGRYTRKAARYVEQARRQLPDRLQDYNFLERTPPAEVFEPEFLATVSTARPLELLRAAYGRVPHAHCLNAMMILDWKFTLADSDLPKVSQMCDVARIAASFPMLDDPVVATALRVPPETLLPGLDLRGFYKQAFASLLPHDIIMKKKHGFGLPFGLWLRDHAGLRALIPGALESLRGRGIFRHAYLDAVVGRHETVDAAYYGEMVWLLTVLELWLQEQGASRPS